MASNRTILIFLLSAMTLALPACTRYSAEPIEGWVIDADTKAAVEGVIVIANWQLHKIVLTKTIPGEHLNILETKTDRYGAYYFDQWGPLLAKWGFFVDRDPILFFYKEGYEFHSVSNPTLPETNNNNVRQSVWNGTSIELKRISSDQDNHTHQLSLLNTAIHSILKGNRCEWKTIPMATAIIIKQKEIFQTNNVHSSLTSLDDISDAKCGSAEEYLKSPKTHLGVTNHNNV